MDHDDECDTHSASGNFPASGSKSVVVEEEIFFGDAPDGEASPSALTSDRSSLDGGDDGDGSSASYDAQIMSYKASESDFVTLPGTHSFFSKVFNGGERASASSSSKIDSISSQSSQDNPEEASPDSTNRERFLGLGHLLESTANVDLQRSGKVGADLFNVILSCMFVFVFNRNTYACEEKIVLWLWKIISDDKIFCGKAVSKVARIRVTEKKNPNEFWFGPAHCCLAT